jgi:hypothetical protein
MGLSKIHKQHAGYGWNSRRGTLLLIKGRVSERNGLKQACVREAVVLVRSHGRVGPLTVVGGDLAIFCDFNVSTRFQWVL